MDSRRWADALAEVGVCVSVDALDWSGVFGLCLEFWNLTGKISFASDLKKVVKIKMRVKIKMW